MAQLSAAQTAFLRDNPFPAIATTLRADGSPHSTIVWVDADESGVSFNTARGRAKDRHLQADGRISLAVVNPTNSYEWLAISGTAALTEDGADAQIDRLAKKYLGEDVYPWRSPTETRVSVRITPERVDGLGFED
ncbi:MAG: PPOX class F420-dependent oxidoreductase [Actinobacteria bacterium]|nr:PPOX class F420-dependent oxidoreductase [Actinomycetota bacterium]